MSIIAQAKNCRPAKGNPAEHEPDLTLTFSKNWRSASFAGSNLECTQAMPREEKNQCLIEIVWDI